MNMKRMIGKLLRPLLNSFGIQATRYRKYPEGFSANQIDIWEAVKPYTMTSPERVGVLVDAVRHLVRNKVEGAMVECGVWKGGSSMAVALTLKELGVEDRDIYLYDTFSGMSAPTEQDVSPFWGNASDIFKKKKTSADASDWCCSSLNEVRGNLSTTRYPAEKLHFVEGKVEDTTPSTVPEKIALLRLDTDWYASTKHEMEHLFPRLAENGVLIIDDYGCWEGARKAVDEYVKENHVCLFLVRIDSSAYVAVKRGSSEHQPMLTRNTI